MSNGGGSDVLSIIVLLFAGYVILCWIAAAILFAATAAYVLLLFVAFVLSVFALLTWNWHLRIGRLHLGPDSSRPFIIRGLIGAALVPAFAFFCQHFFEFPLPKKLWPHLAAAGYAVFALGGEWLELVLGADDADGRYAGPAIEHDPRPATPRISSLQAASAAADASRALVVREDKPTPRAAPSAPPPCPAVEAFRFVTWDDEEEMRARAARRAARESEGSDDDRIVHRL